MPFGRDCWLPRQWPWPPSPQPAQPGSRPDRAVPRRPPKRAHPPKVAGVQGSEAQARRADDQGHEGGRQDRAPPEGRQSRRARDRRRGRRLGRLQLRRATRSREIAHRCQGRRRLRAHRRELRRVHRHDPDDDRRRSGNDRLAGGSGAETLIGGEGNDSIDGNRGNDVARMDAGDDTFVWDPGDGSDVVEGDSGDDTMLFNGANIAEQRRPLRQRQPAAASPATSAPSRWTSNGVETVDFNALGGADTLDVHDLEATDVTSVRTDLGDGDAATTDRRCRRRHERQRRDRRQRRRVRRRRVRPAGAGLDPAPGADRQARRQRPRRQRRDLRASTSRPARSP